MDLKGFCFESFAAPLAISVTLAPASENPFSRKTVPATTAWAESFFCATRPPANTMTSAAILLPVLILFVFFVLVLFLVFVEVVVFVEVLILVVLVGVRRNFQRTHTAH